MIRIGFVLGDLDKSQTTAWSKFVTLVCYLERHSTVVEPVGLYTAGTPTQFPESMSFARIPNKWGLSRWDRITVDVDLYHLRLVPQWGHLPAIRSDRPVVASGRGTAHWATRNTMPTAAHPSRRYKLKYQLRDIVGSFSISRVFCVSDYVKNIYADRAGYSDQQLTTTYVGIEDFFYEMSKTPPPEDFGQYVLHVSNGSMSKNPRNLLVAFRCLQERLDEDLELVIAGSHWQDRWSAFIKELSIESSVELLGHLDNPGRLVQLYDHAECLFFPSYHETFGRPNVEAMVRETPVVTTAQCAIPEVVDGDALLVSDPTDVTELVNALETVLSRNEVRSRLIQRGKERAERFRMAAFRSRTEAAYESVLETA